MEKRLDGKIATIFGATSGIGKVTALLFADHGAKVVVAGRRVELGQAVVDEILAKGGDAIFVEADGLVDADCKMLIDTTVEKYGRIDILVNALGGGTMKMPHEYTSEDYDFIMGLNLKASFLASTFAIPYMMEQKGGSIINISSASTTTVVEGASIYECAKIGLEAWTRCVAKDYAKYGIRCNFTAPGLAKTESFDSWEEEGRKAAEAAHPMGRIGTALEQAYPILWLASDEASYVSGRGIYVTGASYL